eukprot:784493-Prorocentrum_lima.AAC.1
MTGLHALALHCLASAAGKPTVQGALVASRLPTSHAAVPAASHPSSTPPQPLTTPWVPRNTDRFPHLTSRATPTPLHRTHP